MFNHSIFDNTSEYNTSNYSNNTSLEFDSKFHKNNSTSSNDSAYIDFAQTNQINNQHVNLNSYMVLG